MAEHHPHTHKHDAQHGHGHDYAAANKQYFDENIDMFERPDIVDATQRIAAAMRERYASAFNAESTTVLDYACGAGTAVSSATWSSSCVKSIFGVDISQGVVDQYNLLASKHELSDKLKASCVELKADGRIGNSTKQFDIVLCTMAYHHFGNPEDVTKILASFVKPGASLLVVDILAISNKADVVLGDKHRDTVPHQGGFGEDRMKDMVTAAGLVDFEMGGLISGLVIDGHAVTPFLARGVKPL
ncbi:S-adenosyl-L-methionine-dependent methyltransferase [Rhodofomes roseus]|uniref:S-adenosyl-L-methionine-dependent methyltransferase n=1 Tax=Rhodofomes roseus TaxID=34475 RepID=A0ABQ8KWI4_9APHY|nr:S-adenosyl-L-methionine-dependent methyltransferase [Rhodofomes roseus]KAH9843657.1 S-adenosyl-L-methionine-dependent methyltransferase [Rhodofomes roseus]